MHARGALPPGSLFADAPFERRLALPRTLKSF
jgi:hypothetical protein